MSLVDALTRPPWARTVDARRRVLLSPYHANGDEMEDLNQSLSTNEPDDVNMPEKNVPHPKTSNSWISFGLAIGSLLGLLAYLHQWI